MSLSPHNVAVRARDALPRLAELLKESRPVDASAFILDAVQSRRILHQSAPTLSPDPQPLFRIVIGADGEPVHPTDTVNQ